MARLGNDVLGSDRELYLAKLQQQATTPDVSVEILPETPGSVTAMAGQPL